MNYFVHFGRRMPIPSTLQVSHELRAFFTEETRQRCAVEEGLPLMASWKEIIAHRAEAAASH